MSYNAKETTGKLQGITDWLIQEFTTIRTGRATPAVLDGVQIESYGSLMPIPQVASVSIDGPRSLVIAPWDSSLTSEIEKKIRDAGLGLSVSADDKGVRVNFPELTTENRQQLIKVINNKHEEARVSVRSEREKARAAIKKQLTDSDITEDDERHLQDELQKKIDATNTELQEVVKRKEVEIKGQ